MPTGATATAKIKLDAGRDHRDAVGDHSGRHLIRIDEINPIAQISKDWHSNRFQFPRKCIGRNSEYDVRIALVRTHLWPMSGRPAIDPAKVFTEHIKLNKANGLGARLTSAALSVSGMTGLLKKGLENEYKNNLY
ncbi:MULTISPECIES: hypothetical protein [unclassified Bradyrhizobium]